MSGRTSVSRRVVKMDRIERTSRSKVADDTVAPYLGLYDRVPLDDKQLFKRIMDSRKVSVRDMNHEKFKSAFTGFKSKCDMIQMIENSSKELGRGSYGTTYRFDGYMYNGTAISVAVKVISFKYTTTTRAALYDENRAFSEECRVSKFLDDLGVGPKIYDYYVCNEEFVKKGVKKPIIRSESWSGIVVMELLDHIPDDPKDEFYDMFLSKTKIMHDHGVYHNDLYKRNIMCRKNSNGVIEPVIIDFGAALVLPCPVPHYARAAELIGAVMGHFTEYRLDKNGQILSSEDINFSFLSGLAGHSGLQSTIMRKTISLYGGGPAWIRLLSDGTFIKIDYALNLEMDSRTLTPYFISRLSNKEYYRLDSKNRFMPLCNASGDFDKSSMAGKMLVRPFYDLLVAVQRNGTTIDATGLESTDPTKISSRMWEVFNYKYTASESALIREMFDLIIRHESNFKAETSGYSFPTSPPKIPQNQPIQPQQIQQQEIPQIRQIQPIQPRLGTKSKFEELIAQSQAQLAQLQASVFKKREDQEQTERNELKNKIFSEWEKFAGPVHIGYEKDGTEMIRYSEFLRNLYVIATKILGMNIRNYNLIMENGYKFTKLPLMGADLEVYAQTIYNVLGERFVDEHNKRITSKQ